MLSWMSVCVGKAFFLPNHETQGKTIDGGDMVYNALAVLFTSVPNHLLIPRACKCVLSPGIWMPGNKDVNTTVLKAQVL